MNKITFKIQVALTNVIITLGAVTAILGLGFMTSFYKLFMDGNNDMFKFFKDLQPYNTQVFTAGLTFLVMALFLQSFDINKKIAGYFGVAYTLILSITHIFSGISLIKAGNILKGRYMELDFTALEGYVPSTSPFDLTSVFVIVGIVLTIALFVTTGINFMAKKGEEV